MREINERDLSAAAVRRPEDATAAGAAGRDRRGVGERNAEGEQKGRRDARRTAERPAAPPRGELCAVL